MRYVTIVVLTLRAYACTIDVGVQSNVVIVNCKEVSHYVQYKLEKILIKITRNEFGDLQNIDILD